ncbi:hypothetical protein HY797_01400 [Candidatus Falkowbacteria bacterium]|nr:hypothetical protein [Candidatus Falkowbacteria bacterium]
MFSNKIFIVLVCIFLLAGAVFLGILSWQTLSQKQKPQVNVEEIPSHLTVPKNTTTIEVPKDFISPTTTAAAATTSNTVAPVSKDLGVVWLAEPIKLENLKLVKEGSNDFGDVEVYYKVAVLDGGGEIINAYVPGMGGSSVIRFKKTAQGQYYLIKQNSDFDLANAGGLKINVAIDAVTKLNSLTAPEQLVVGKMIFVKKSWYDKNPLSLTESEKISATDSGDFFKKLDATNFQMSYVNYVLRLADSSVIYYDLSYDFLADDNSLVAEFNSDSQAYKTKKFDRTIRQGCSFAGASGIIYPKDLAGRLRDIGATNSSSALYAPLSSDDELVKAVYEGYKVGRDPTITYDGKPVLSYQDLAAKQPVIVWRDALGDYHIFPNSDYGPLAECGKPVIYLYPETKIEVKVKVGAKVRISEPDYGDGWKVVANPDGKIINGDGAVYENLYWEGLGRGYYPSIKEGRVVKRINIEAELRSDLAVLGLNEKEIFDFMDFWLAKMPKTAYIRLTWLDTNEMNELAPLAISPRPDTVKRVFLDFAGQNTEATDLASQKLKGFERNGFTVVEWGGLLAEKK